MIIHIVLRKNYINDPEKLPIELFVDLRTAMDRFNELKTIEEVTIYSTEI